MSRDFFVKILGSQESGYSGDRPNQRGKYILIGKKFLSIFPYLSELTLNDQAVMRCKTPGDYEIAVNIVYHNAKYFPETHQRDHDEVRLYRNSKLDEALSLDRGVIVIATKFDDGAYGFVSIQEKDFHYESWREIAEKGKNQGTILYDSIKNKIETKQLIALGGKEYKNIQNSKEVIDEYTTRLIKTRKQQPEYIHTDDPAKPLENMFHSQEIFKDYVREMYGGKCALRGKSLILDRYEGLEAAHIHAHTRKGPLLPTNGILLSEDLHAAFDAGFFTLDEENKVMISKKVPSKSKLWDFHEKSVMPIEGYELYKPFSSYTKWHRNEIFERRYKD